VHSAGCSGRSIVSSSQFGSLSRTVARTLSRRGVIFAIYVVLLTVTGFLFHTVPSGFRSHQDKLYLFAGAKLPPGAALARTDVVTHQMVQIAHTVDGVDIMPAMPALTPCSFVNTPNLQASYVILKPFDQRRRTAAQNQCRTMPSSRVLRTALPTRCCRRRSKGSAMVRAYSLYLEDRGRAGLWRAPDALDKFQAAIAKPPGMSYPVSSYQANIPQLEVRVDAVQAKAKGWP